MRRLFGEMYATGTLRQFLRELTHGHRRQLTSAPRAHPVALARRTPLLPGIERRVFVDIDSLLHRAW